MSIHILTGLSRVSLLCLSTAYLFVPLAHAQSHDHDEIISTGSLIPSARSRQAIGVSVIGPNELNRNMASSLGEILKFEAGISSTFFGAGASRPIIRGQGGARVLMLDNGIASIDAAASSPDHAPAIEPALASQIDIIRGTGLLRYGSAATGGVINVIDGRIPDPAHIDKNQGVITVAASSNDQAHEFSAAKNFAVHTAKNQTLILHAEYAKRQSEDYKIPSKAADRLGLEDTRLDNSDTAAESFALGLSHQSGSILIGGAFKNIESEYGLPGGAGARILLSQNRGDFKFHYDLDSILFEQVEVIAGIADYEHVEVESNGEIGTIFTNKGGEIRAEIVQKSILTRFGSWQGAHGVHFNTRDFTANGEEAFVPPTQTDMKAAFSFHEWSFGDNTIEAAVRIEDTKVYDNTDNERNFTGLSASIGLNRPFNENNSFHAHFFRTERAPTSDELFANGVHLATGQFEIGDFNLEKEIANGGELSWRASYPRGQLTINGFYTHYQDYIYQSSTGDIFTSDEGDELLISQTIADDINFYGFEVQADYGLGQWGQLNWSADFSLEKVTAKLSNSPHNFLPRIPALGLSLGLEASVDRLTNRVEIAYTAAQNNTAPLETVTADYALIDWLIEYEIRDNLSLNLAVKNLTNTSAHQHTSYLKDRIALPGRNFTARLRYQF